MNDSSSEQRIIAECGKRMVVAAVPVYSTDGRLHPATLVAACARMAGYYLFRSFGLTIPDGKPGDPVLSPEASVKTPVLLRTCAAVLASLGNTIPPEPPTPLVDDRNKPREDFLATQARLAPVFAPIVASFSLDDYQAARAAAVATALAAHTVRKHLEPACGFGVAVFAFTEGSRTIPAPR